MNTKVKLKLEDVLKNMKKQVGNGMILGHELELRKYSDVKYIQLAVKTNETFRALNHSELLINNEILIGLSKFEAKLLGKFLITIADENT